MQPRITLLLIRCALALATFSLAGDILGWDACGQTTCGSGLWLRYRYLHGLVPVSGLALLATFIMQTLWQLHIGNADRYPGYARAGWWLLCVSVGVASFHVYAQVALIGEYCLPCLCLTAALAGVLLVAPRPSSLNWRAGAMAAAVGFFGFNFLHHHGAERGPVSAPAILETALAVPPASPEDHAEDLHSAKAIGGSEAPVTLEVFSDLACPHCARFEADVLPVLIDRFVQPGRLRIVQRSFYAAGHDEAAVADVLAHGAVFVHGAPALQAARREFFRQQDAWPEQPVLALAGLVDPRTLLRAVQTHRSEIKAVLEADLNRARELGITAPPSFAITAGEHRDIIVGMRSPEVFVAAVERALGQVTP